MEGKEHDNSTTYHGCSIVVVDPNGTIEIVVVVRCHSNQRTVFRKS